jgi:hypothetical protein
MDRTGDHYAKRNKPSTERQVPYNLLSKISKIVALWRQCMGGMGKEKEA